MPRRIRLFIPGGIYHVYNRISRGEHIFERRGAAEHWVDAVREEMQLHELKILAWCLMPNHYHLVVKTSWLPMWHAMARFQARVAREHNRRRKVKGPLWQSRYKARLVDGNRDLENLVAYVHLNPVTAGIALQPSDYRLSGHREMIGLEVPRLVDVAEALLTYDEVPAVGRMIYSERLRAVTGANWCRFELGDLPWWREVDDNELTMPLEDPPPEATTFVGEGLPPEDHLRPDGATVVKLFEMRYGLPNGHLAGNSRRRLDSRLRCLFSTLAVCCTGFRVCDVAGLLGKAPGSVSRWVSKGYELRNSDPEFRADLAALHRDVEALPPARDAVSRADKHTSCEL